MFHLDQRLTHPHDFINGLDGDTGLLQPPKAHRAAETQPLSAREYRRLAHWAENRDQLRLPVHGIDPEQLAEAGWAVLFGAGVELRIREALRPLLRLRKNQAGELYREIQLPSDPSALDFLCEHQVAFGPAVPRKLPYYLLLVGDPEQIPFEFQYRLDIQYAVGRIHLETCEGYERYANSVVQAEQSTDKQRPAVFWGTQIEGDDSSQWMMRGLVEPLVSSLRAGREAATQGLYQVEQAPDGRKATLARLLGREVPAFLFTASHGMLFSHSPRRRREAQGALLCEDWRPGQVPVPQQAFFAAEDLEDEANLAGLILFHFACFSTGCSRHDPFERGPVGAGRLQSERSFVARLTQRLLAHGAQAVVGHIDRAFSTSFTWEEEGDQTRVFASMLRQLLAGHRLGHATETVNTRYAEYAAELNPLLLQRPREGTPSAELLRKLHRATLDARNYLVIGDPAVRLVGAKVRRPVIRPPSAAS